MINFTIMLFLSALIIMGIFALVVVLVTNSHQGETEMESQLFRKMVNLERLKKQEEREMRDIRLLLKNGWKLKGE